MVVRLCFYCFDRRYHTDRLYANHKLNSHAFTAYKFTRHFCMSPSNPTSLKRIHANLQTPLTNYTHLATPLNLNTNPILQCFEQQARFSPTASPKPLPDMQVSGEE